MKSNLIMCFAVVSLILLLCACGEKNSTFDNELWIAEEPEIISNAPQNEMTKREPIVDNGDTIAKIEIDGNLLDLLPDERRTYLAVLENIDSKIALDAGSIDTGRGLFYNIDDSGCAELIICYEYPEANLIFEVWTIIDEKAVQLAAVSDLGDIAGAGNGGVHLVSYDGQKHLCFWTYNVSPWPPGQTLDRYEISEWTVADGRLIVPRRMSVEFFAGSRGVDEVLASFSIYSGTQGEISREVCQVFLNRYIEEPDAILCRSTGLGEPLGFTLEELKMRLKE